MKKTATKAPAIWPAQFKLAIATKGGTLKQWAADNGFKEWRLNRYLKGALKFTGFEDDIRMFKVIEMELAELGKYPMFGTAYKKAIKEVKAIIE